jgi:hypothetical protein
MENFFFRIGGVSIAISTSPDCLPLEIPERYCGLSGDPGSSPVTFRIHQGSKPLVDCQELIFASGFWNLFRYGGRYAVDLFYSDPPGSGPLAIWDKDWQTVDFYLPQREPASGPASESLAEILDPLLIDLLLADKRLGMILHACGVDDGGQGLLFLGPPNVGKSTMGKLWKEGGAATLSDDRVIIRRLDGRFWIYGTPWCSYPELVSTGRAPLDKVFFLKHAPDNEIKLLSPAEAAARLLTNCFPPFYDQEAMVFILEFCGHLASEIPACELGFIPDQSAVEFLRSLK